MPENIRALIVVLFLAVPAFYISRRIAASMGAYREYAVWRNAWFAVTIVGFLSGNYFIFAAVVAMGCLYAHSVRRATVALFIILLFAMPLVSADISVFGVINKLISLNNARLFAIVLLLPILFATARLGYRNGGVSAVPDFLIIGYVLLVIALSIWESNATSIIRSATELILDILVPYFAISRAVTSVADFRKVLLAFVVAVLPLSLIAVVETAKGWLLYNSVAENWGGNLVSGREGLFRGSASAGSIVLGFIIIVAMGCTLAIRQTTIPARGLARIAMAVFTAALIANLSRGPWIGAAVLVVVYLATGPNASAKLAMYAMIGAVALMLLALLPVGQRLIDLLPFTGSAESGSASYRQLLIESSIPVIERNPWFGSDDFLSAPEFQKLITGQQMIDVVNTYLSVVLGYGLVGLGLFVGFFAAILVGLWRVFKLGAVRDIDFSVYARASIATLIAILVTIGTVSSVGYIPCVYWSFAGLCVALIRIAYRERTAVARTALANPVPR